MALCEHCSLRARSYRIIQYIWTPLALWEIQRQITLRPVYSRSYIGSGSPVENSIWSYWQLERVFEWNLTVKWNFFTKCCHISFIWCFRGVNVEAPINMYPRETFLHCMQILAGIGRVKVGERHRNACDITSYDLSFLIMEIFWRPQIECHLTVRSLKQQHSLLPFKI